MSSTTTTTEDNSNFSESKETEQTAKPENSNQFQNIKNPNELYDLSQKLFKEKKFENVFEPIQRALDILKTKHPNDETHVEFSQYYLLYGKALLRIHQSKNNVFGTDDVDLGDEEDEVEEDEPSPQPEDVPLISDSTQSKENVEKPETTTNNPESSEEKDTQEINDVSDAELCWQYLELARLSLDKFLEKFKSSNDNNNNTNTEIELNDENKSKYSVLLAQTHSYIGDFLLEDGKGSESLIEYEKSIEILNSVNGSKREISSMHFLACMAAEIDQNIEKLEYHRGESEMLLVEYIKNLLIDNNFEIKEKDEELTFELLKEKVDIFLEQNKDNDKFKSVCEELKEVTQILDDLCERNDTGPSNETHENNEGLDMTEFSKLLSGPDGLKALINSEMVKNLNLPDIIDDKENTDNNNTNDEKKGVTTFGFGDNNDNDPNEKVNELSSNCVRSKRPQKRKLNESNVTNEHVPESKRTKLNPTSNSSD